MKNNTIKLFYIPTSSNKLRAPEIRIYKIFKIFLYACSAFLILLSKWMANLKKNGESWVFFLKILSLCLLAFLENTNLCNEWDTDRALWKFHESEREYSDPSSKLWVSILLSGTDWFWSTLSNTIRAVTLWLIHFELIAIKLCLLN